MSTDQNLTLIFDAVTKSVVVTFRGRMKLLIGPYPTRAAAVTAGRAFAENLAGLTAWRTNAAQSMMTGFFMTKIN